MEKGGVYSILFKGKRKIASGNTVNDFETVEIAKPGDTRKPPKGASEPLFDGPTVDPTD